MIFRLFRFGLCHRLGSWYRTWSSWHRYIKSLHRRWRAAVASIPHHYSFAGNPSPLDSFFSSLPCALVYTSYGWITRYGFLLRAAVYTPGPVWLCTAHCDVLVPTARPACLLPFCLFFVDVSVPWCFVPPARLAFRVTISFAYRFCVTVWHKLKKVAGMTIARDYLQLSYFRIDIFRSYRTVQKIDIDYTLFSFVCQWSVKLGYSTAS